MVRFSLIPREEQFFKDFVELATHVRSGARALCQMIDVDPPSVESTAAIKELEHICDKATRSIIDRLNRTFVTPLDREDIHALATSLDDVMDGIDAAAAVIKLYRIIHIRPGARRLAEIIADSVDLIHEAFIALAQHDGVLELAARVNQLEHEADRAHQDAIVSLFDEEQDAITLIKWKEILDILEAATDRCEDVANLLESVVVKHA